MRIFIALLALAAGFLISPVLGQENCPTINLHGPMGIVPPGGTVTYKATVEPIEKNWPLKYKWSISSGKIEAGQGTSTVIIRQGETGLTVTLEISGLPENCPDTFSDTSIGDPSPSAVKVGIWKKGQALTTHHPFAEELAQYPDNQGYVFLVRGPESTEDSVSKLKRTILGYAPVDPSRLTIVEAEGPEELAEIWRVPPGAENPKCESCKTVECPRLKMVIPDRVTTSGDTAEFSLMVDPVPGQPVAADWQVSSGTIEKGQGTEKISVRTIKESAGQSLMVTAQVQGLPPGCDSTVSGVTAVSAIVDPFILLDDWGRIPVNDEKGRLVMIAVEASKRPGSIIQFILYLSPDERASSFTGRINRIKEFLTKRYKIPPARLIFVNGGRRETRTRVYLTAMGTELFQP